MEVKKHRLLLMIQQPPDAAPPASNQPVGKEAVGGSYPLSGGEGLEGATPTGSDIEELVGKKCQAPLEEVSIL